MQLTQYRKFVQNLLSIEPAKVGIKTHLKKKRLMNLGHVIIGLATEVGELITGMRGVIEGSTLLTDDSWRPNAREELGDIAFYMTWIAMIEHVKLPAPTKMVKLTGTPAENLLKLNGLAIDLLDVHKKLYYGREHDEVRIKDLMGQFIPLYYGVCNQLFGEPPVVFMIENHGKLSARYPEGFNPENEKYRNLAKEAAAAKAAKAATDAASGKTKPKKTFPPKNAKAPAPITEKTATTEKGATA